VGSAREAQQLHEVTGQELRHHALLHRKNLELTQKRNAGNNGNGKNKKRK